jgi:hypothetical protein
MIKLHDLFIGNYAITQKFGANPDTYSFIKDYAGRPIKGHNGVDWGYGGKNGALLINPFPKGHEVVVSKVGFDSGGFGHYLRIWDKTQKFVILYAHCQEVVVREWQNLQFQQLVAIGDNTGWSTGPHLHAGAYFVDEEGNRLNQDNGFNGYVNLLDKTIIEWQILNPVKPAEVSQVEENTPLAVCLRDRKDFWDKWEAEKRAHETDNQEKDARIKQLETDIANIGKDLENATKSAQNLINANTEMVKIIEQKDEIIKQNNSVAEQKLNAAVKIAAEAAKGQTRAELEPLLYFNQKAGKLLVSGLIKALGGDIKPKGGEENGEGERVS